MESAQCFNCEHLFSDAEVLRCLAFPSGIPAEIITGAFDHTKEYPGDNGIRFKPRAEPPPEEREELPT